MLHNATKSSYAKKQKEHPSLSLFQRAAISSRHYVGRPAMEHSNKRESLRQKAERKAQYQ
jgi:hypothetical protein